MKEVGPCELRPRLGEEDKLRIGTLVQEKITDALLTTCSKNKLRLSPYTAAKYGVVLLLVTPLSDASQHFTAQLLCRNRYTLIRRIGAKSPLEGPVACLRNLRLATVAHAYIDSNSARLNAPCLILDYRHQVIHTWRQAIWFSGDESDKDASLVCGGSDLVEKEEKQSHECVNLARWSVPIVGRESVYSEHAYLRLDTKTDELNQLLTTFSVAVEGSEANEAHKILILLLHPLRVELQTSFRYRSLAFANTLVYLFNIFALLLMRQHPVAATISSIPIHDNAEVMHLMFRDVTAQ